MAHVKTRDLLSVVVILMAMMEINTADPPISLPGKDISHLCCNELDGTFAGFTKPRNMVFLIGAQKAGTTWLFDELDAKYATLVPIMCLQADLHGPGMQAPQHAVTKN